MKRCSKCGENKPRKEFRPRKSSRDGLHGWCNPCYRTYYSAAMRRWRKENPERDAENARRYRTANPESALSRYQRYRERNRERLIANAARRRAENPEAVRAAYARWRASHREQELDRLHRRRDATANPSPETVARIAELLTEPCAYCGSAESITVDHVVPLARGGKHEPANLAPACHRCNCSKGSKTLYEWLGISDLAA